MGATIVKSRKSFADVFESENQEAYYSQSLLKYAEVKCKRPFENGASEESEFFVAMRSADRKFVLCVVWLFKRFGDEVYFKVISEFEGPFTRNKCPQEIMRLLSPVENLKYQGYAKEWRERHQAA